VAASREAGDADNFRAAGLSPLAGEVVQPERAQEWPIQMEAKVHKLYRVSGERPEKLGGGIAAEVEILRVHVAPEFIDGDNYIDPEKSIRKKWSSLI
jgi:flavin reductase (DIM6/NTAB) family NADH-FMN oxidoreductase RutF